MIFKFSSEKLNEIKVDALVLGIYEGEKTLTDSLTKVDKDLNGLISEVIRSGEIKGKIFETYQIHTHDKIGAKKILLMGCGEKKIFDALKYTQVVGTAFRALAKKGNKTLAFVIPSDINPIEKITLGVEGILTSSFDPAIYKTEKNNNSEINEITLVDNSYQPSKKLDEAIDQGKIVGEAINWARNLVSEPANILTPTKMVGFAKEIAKEYQLEVEVIDEKKARELGMGAFSAISQGSDEPSYLISLTYRPKKASKKTLALLGKGVTFDSGGLSIKPSDKMHEMKMDMAGAAAVMATMKVVGQIKPQISVIGITPLTENLPSGKAVKPGDVVKALNGKTIEIVNTDAEGRVVLADALVWAEKLGATHVVDIATLTGAVIVALGDEVTAVLGNKETWSEKVLNAAKESGEKMWLLPTFDLYKDLLKSSIADYANVPPSRQAGVIAGAMFLNEFVKKETPWAHLDIGGTAWLDTDKPYMAKGPSGVGVKTFINLIKILENDSR